MDSGPFRADAELQAIVKAVRVKSETCDFVGKRDYALLLFYLITGMRRQERIGLRGPNLKLEEDALVITDKVKGGNYISREVRDPNSRGTTGIFDGWRCSIPMGRYGCGTTEQGRRGPKSSPLPYCKATSAGIPC